MKIVVGGVYYNDRGDEINVQFVTADLVAYDHYVDGKKTSVDGVKHSQLQKVLREGGFFFDHQETW